MPLLTLPQTRGCLVCGRDNPHGLRLTFSVDDASGVVSSKVTFPHETIGFADVIHGGVVATVLDEAMVWAATWAGKRFCLCGEMTVRYLQPTRPSVAYQVTARVESARARLVLASATLIDAAGVVVATGSAKYLPVSVSQHEGVNATLVRDPSTAAAAVALGAATT